MTKQNIEILLVAVYGNFQKHFHKIGLVDDTGTPIPKKKMNLDETRRVSLYDFVSYKLHSLSRIQLQSRADEFNDLVGKLINEEQLVDNYLMAIMLLRNYLDELAIPIERNAHINKINDVIKLFESMENTEENDFREIKKITARVTDNIWRILTGKAQLSDEIRDLRARRFVK